MRFLSLITAISLIPTAVSASGLIVKDSDPYEQKALAQFNARFAVGGSGTEGASPPLALPTTVIDGHRGAPSSRLENTDQATEGDGRAVASQLADEAAAGNGSEAITAQQGGEIKTGLPADTSAADFYKGLGAFLEALIDQFVEGLLLKY
jgi:hypothetical protein